MKKNDLGNKEIMAKNIRCYLNVREKTQADLSRDLEFPPTTVSEWLTAKSYPRIDRIEMMANYFGIEKSDLVEESTGAVRTKAVLVPVLGRVQAGLPIEAIENIIDYEEISEEVARCGEHFGLQVKGNSMEPRYKNTPSKIADLSRVYFASQHLLPK